MLKEKRKLGKKMFESKRTVISGIVLAGIVSVVLLNIAPMTHSSVGLPDYNSGWVPINQGQRITLTHNLGTTNVSIEMLGKDSGGHIHQRNYGGLKWMKSGYDSGWISISQGAEKIFTHNLGTTNVVVYLMGKYDAASPYIHQIDYGGENNVLNKWTGAYWKDLTPTTITVKRHGDDTNWNYVRVVIWKVESMGSQGDGYQCCLASNYNGSYWDNLTNSTIDVYRAPNDPDWNQVNVRIWKIEQSQGVGGLYVPVDKFSLLAPYIAVVSTIILAVSISVAYIKHRKKQQTSSFLFFIQ